MTSECLPSTIIFAQQQRTKKRRVGGHPRVWKGWDHHISAVRSFARRITDPHARTEIPHQLYMFEKILREVHRAFSESKLGDRKVRNTYLRILTCPPLLPLGVHERSGIRNPRTWRPRSLISHGGGKSLAPEQHQGSSIPRLYTRGRHYSFQDKVRERCSVPPPKAMRTSYTYAATH